MNSYSAEHQKHKRNLPLFTLLMILLITVLLHLLFLFLFKPIHYTARQVSSGSRYTVICKPDEISGKDSWQLQYWLKYMDPEAFVKPNDQLGFSMVHRIQNQEFLKPKQLPLDLYSRAGGMMKRDRVSPVREFFDFQPHIYLPVISSETEKKNVEKPYPPHTYPVWTDSRRQTLFGLLSGNEEAKRILQKNTAKQSTIFQLIFPAPDFPPEIRILRSSGNRELDVMGQRQLFLYAVEQGLKKENMFYVTWNRPPGGGKVKKVEK